MYDSTTATDIPATAEMVAGYIDGKYAWSDADWARFPTAVKVRIAVSATTEDGHVLDVEPGDATPAQAVGWVTTRRAAGVDPSVYCNASTWPQVAKAFRDAGVGEPHYWIAQYDNDPTIPDGAVAKQYANDDLLGAHYDASVVADYWPGVEEDMTEAQVRQIVQDYLANVYGPQLEKELEQKKAEAVVQAVKAIADKLSK